MTAHSAQLHDETLRREITRWQQRVNVRGERIALPTEGPLGQAAWMQEHFRAAASRREQKQRGSQTSTAERSDLVAVSTL